jgi:hypothetical protein
MKILLVCLLAVVVGCSIVPRNNSVGIDGYFGHVSDDSVMLGIGRFDAVPKEMQLYKVEYSEDTAFFSPSTKICRWSILCSGGTNAIPKAVETTTNLFLYATGTITNSVGGVR